MKFFSFWSLKVSCCVLCKIFHVRKNLIKRLLFLLNFKNNKALLAAQRVYDFDIHEALIKVFQKIIDDFRNQVLVIKNASQSKDFGELPSLFETQIETLDGLVKRF